MELNIVAYRPEHLEKILFLGFLQEMGGAMLVQVPLNIIKVGSHYDPSLVTPLMPISDELKAKVQEAFIAVGLPVLFGKV